MKKVLAIPKPPFKVDRVYRGLPVPYTVVWLPNAEKPDFTSIDSRRVSRILRNNLCGICSFPFETDIRVWLAGYHEAKVIMSTWFTDPPMHLKCARYTLKVCPFYLHDKVREDTPDGTMPDEEVKALYVGRGIQLKGYSSRPKKLVRIERLA